MQEVDTTSERFLALSLALDQLISRLEKIERSPTVQVGQRLFKSSDHPNPLHFLCHKLRSARDIFGSQLTTEEEGGREIGELLRILNLIQHHPRYPQFTRVLKLLRIAPLNIEALFAIANSMSEISSSPCRNVVAIPDEEILNVDGSAWVEAPSFRGAGTANEVTIVLPVYRGIEETLTCIRSVLFAKGETPARLLVINDNSPDAELSIALEKLSAKKLFDLIVHKDNRGFVSSVNEGMLNARGDVILLNSDTVVPNYWIDNIMFSAGKMDDVGSISPLANNATILSYPFINRANTLPEDADLELICSYLDEYRKKFDLIDVPTTVGFCMYIPKRAIEDVGIFDEAAFGMGYGEESDWAMRALAKGYRHYVSPSTFVFHHGSVSFSDAARQREAEAGEVIRRRYPHYWPLVASHIHADPLRFARRYLDECRVFRVTKKSPVVMHILHSLGGGTRAFADDLAKILQGQGIGSLFVTPGPEGSVEIKCNFLADVPNLKYSLPNEANELSEFIKKSNIKEIHVHHIIGFSKGVEDIICGFDGNITVTLHDYMFFCPQIVLLDQRNLFCGVQSGAVCNRCISQKPPAIPVASVSEWRSRMRKILSCASTVIAPSETAANLYHRVWPDLPIKVIPHPEDWEPHARLTRPPLSQDAPRVVATIGAIAAHKGPGVLSDCVRDAERRQLPLKFVVIGELVPPIVSPKLIVTGRFVPTMLPKLIAESGASIGFLPSIWPETYSYVISEFYKFGLFPVVLDLGAQEERVRRSFGRVLPLHLGASAMNDAFLSMDIGTSNQAIAPYFSAREYLRSCYGEQLFPERKVPANEMRNNTQRGPTTPIVTTSSTQQ